MAIPESQSTLKSYFETGDVPTQAQFAAMIDTFFYLIQLANTQSAAAEAAADAAETALAAALTKTPVALVEATLGVSSPWTKNSSLNVTSVTGFGSNTVRVNFTVAVGDSNYVVLATIGGSGGANPLVITGWTRNTAYVDITFNSNITLSSAGAKLSVAIFNPS